MVHQALESSYDVIDIFCVICYDAIKIRMIYYERSVFTLLSYISLRVDEFTLDVCILTYLLTQRVFIQLILNYTE